MIRNLRGSSESRLANDYRPFLLGITNQSILAFKILGSKILGSNIFSLIGDIGNK